EPEYRQGNSRFVDKRIAQILPAMEDLNRQVKKDAEKIAKGIADLTQEAVALALRTDQGSVRRRDDIQSITRQMDQRLLEIFSTFSNNAVGSYPEYRVDNLSKRHSSYLFYKPILYRQRGHADSFVHGVVFVEVSTQELLEHIEGLQRDLIKMVFYVSLIALACGVFGAWILASIIIKPIRRLASHVAMIRDTEKKEELEGKLIAIKGQDEIALLGRTINDMTEGLIKAALASKDLTVGKEIQKMFIPLDTNTEGRKLTSGYTCDDHVEFFGYYEGALGVSGDYFDYIKLDDQHYAIIKCDVAGKGVPAALIMVEVATLFQNFFKDWNIQSHGINLSDIVSRINDLIEARGFKGRFAAFTLCIFNTVSGTVHFCNAGDNIIHIYDAQQRKMKRITLAQTSAAGVFPSFMIDMKGGFGVETLTLRTGDVLFLYTDGIEEAKRLFRNKRFELVLCQEQGLAHDAPHETHTVGQAGEELGAERVSSIIESVFLRKGFSLQKWHNPVEGEKFEFDFSSCEGNLDEAVLALV
ncbi:SpoIIE family protein phosphatase, partial [Treponema pallidum]